MKNILLSFLLVFITSLLFSQNDKAVYKTYKPGFYHNFILKDVRHVNEELKEKEAEKHLKLDQSDKNIPDNISDYKKVWAQPTLSQGNAGTCWAYGGTSFFESEIKRQIGKNIKLSEIHTVYWEYLEKARRFVSERGKSRFTQGSQANAVTRMIKLYGAMPESAYSGLKNGRKYHSHDEMFKEMKNYLDFVKQNDVWNEETILGTIKSIMNHHIGEPPAEFDFEGKTYTAETFRDDVLKFNADDYVDIISTIAFDYHKKGKYDVPDNWWNCKSYLNLPLNEYMQLINKSIDKGYTVAIGGDVSETGFSRETNAALIPNFDIESKNIDANAREFRFYNGSSSDDHIMHLIGHQKHKRNYWYLVKDSSSGSRNVGEDSEKFGYYFMHEDYVKLKVLTFTVHKDMVED